MKDSSSKDEEKKRKRKEEKRERKKQKREDESTKEQETIKTEELHNNNEEEEEKEPVAVVEVVERDNKKKKKKKDKKEKKDKKKKKKKKNDNDNASCASSDEETSSSSSGKQQRSPKKKKHKQLVLEEQHQAETKELTGAKTGRIVASSAIEFYDEQMKESVKQNTEKPEEKAQNQFNITLLLMYQYIEPVWDEPTYQFMLHKLEAVGKQFDLTGRMRVAREGVNCTLTGSHENIVLYCKTLRALRPKEFASTEFKLTSDLPLAQKFPNLKVLKVVELVHYGLEGPKAPPIAKFSGVHLEPKDYHKKLGESNTVIIDVRNHYEAAIGRFVPPNQGEGVKQGEEPPKWLDPKMRKSTEFPVWLDKPNIMEEMKGKQVLMYCTGGIRCERASALLKYKMETDPDIKALDIKGVFQLQGGIDKYFKEFPEGGYWKGKNYVFDKRFAHAPPKIDGALHGKTTTTNEETTTTTATQLMGKCEACQEPWDMYRGKRRCPTCGVPSLICRDCFVADKDGQKKLGKEIRCDLCVEQGITSKRELREKGEQDIKAYERKMHKKGMLKQPDTNEDVTPANPTMVTRLHLKNMCKKDMDEATLIDTLPGITHIVWRVDRKSGNFLGQAWVEMATPDDAARAVGRDGKINVYGRPLYIAFQAPDGKDAWPLRSSAVTK